MRLKSWNYRVTKETYDNQTYNLERFSCNECECNVQIIMLLKKHYENHMMYYDIEDIAQINVTLKFKLWYYWRNIGEFYNMI